MNSVYLILIGALEKIYGKANDTAFGSAVFHGPVTPAANIDDIAMQHYKAFLGKKLTSQTETNWFQPWKKVYERSPEIKADILTEYNGIKDTNAQISLPLITELIENAGEGKQALAEAYNHAGVNAMAVFTIGDGEAFSGIITTGIYSNEYGCSVITLMD